MPVRTSAAVASGLGLLTLIGVGTIFGDSIVAMVAPPAIEGVSIAAKADTASFPSKAASKPSPTKRDDSKPGPTKTGDAKPGAATTAETPTPAPTGANRAAGDVGRRSPPDGSS